jgi:hypothetical protein
MQSSIEKTWIIARLANANTARLPDKSTTIFPSYMLVVGSAGIGTGSCDHTNILGAENLAASTLILALKKRYASP